LIPKKLEGKYPELIIDSPHRKLIRLSKNALNLRGSKKQKMITIETGIGENSKTN
jgi:hypothetical protein